MDFHLLVLQVSYPTLKNLKSSYLVYLHLEKIWFHFPKGRISDFVAVWGRVIKSFIKKYNDANEILIFSLKNTLPLFRNSNGFGSIWKYIFIIYRRGIGTPIC